MSSSTKPIRIAVTGAGGQIGYALIFRIASGAAFGPDQAGFAPAAGDHPGLAVAPAGRSWNWTTARFRSWPT